MLGTDKLFEQEDMRALHSARVSHLKEFAELKLKQLQDKELLKQFKKGSRKYKDFKKSRYKVSKQLMKEAKHKLESVHLTIEERFTIKKDAKALLRIDTRTNQKRRITKMKKRRTYIFKQKVKMEQKKSKRKRR